MKIFFFLLFALPSRTFSEEFPEEDEVLVLNQGNFMNAILQYQHILVEFYAPWCGHCKALAPNYAEAARKLKEEKSDIRLAKVDATTEKQLASQFEVRGFPTIKFFVNGVPRDFKGGRETEQIIAWLKKKTGDPARLLATAAEVERFQKTTSPCVIGYFPNPDSEEVKTFVKAADIDDSVEYAITNDKDIMEAQTHKPGLILYSDYDEEKFTLLAESEAFNPEGIESFVKRNLVPIGAEFDDTSSSRVFASDIKKHMLVIMSGTLANIEDHKATVKTVAWEFKGQMSFMWIDADKESNAGVLRFFDEEEPSEGNKIEPIIWSVNFSDDTERFKPEDPTLSEDNLRIFATKVLAGEVERHLKAAPLPEDWDAKPVKVLVGSNFESIVQGGKNVLVEFYAPWCGHCKKLEPIYNELAEKFEDNTEILITKMDATANELKDVRVQGFPTIKYFKADGSVVDYKGARTLEALTKFLESGGKVEEEEEEEQEEEEESDEEQKESKEEESKEESEEKQADKSKEEL